MSRKKVVLLRSVASNTNLFFFNALKRMEIDLVDVAFDPRRYDQDLHLPDGDVLLAIDCGLQVDFSRLAAYGRPKHFVSIDSCHKLKLHKAYCEKYRFDFVWVAQKHMVEEFAPNAAWLPLAADETVHVFRPEMMKYRGVLERLLRRGRYDIGMCGSSYRHRRRFEKLFKKAGLITNFHYGKKLREEATLETALCTIGFNVAAGFTGHKGQDINMRIFETMVNGRAMLLTNTYDGLGYEDLFDEGRHYIGFRTEQEAVEKALHYAGRPDEAARIAKAGQEHALANHLYIHRCKTIIDSLD